MRLPTIADKTFLISIGDRSVGGMTARDQMVGPWQVPVADVAVTTMGYQGYLGEAFAMGERTPLAVLDAPASGRMAIGEALTNLAAADVGSLDKVKLSANWMAPCGVPGEDARLYATVEGICRLCKQIGVSIPVGKDSLSMRTAWDEGGEKKQVVSPLSLIVTAFAAVDDVRKTKTPLLATDQGEDGESELLLLDLGQNRLGGSCLAQVYNATGDDAPDVDEPAKLKGLFDAVQKLNRDGLLHHDRSDGGLFVAACEMAFASRCGVSLDLDGVCFDAAALDVDGAEKRPDLMAGRDFEHCPCPVQRGARCADPDPPRRPREGHADPARLRCTVPLRRPPERVGRNPRHPQCQARAAREARRPAACLVGNQLPHAGDARQPRLRAAGIRPHPRYQRSWSVAQADI
ncbi:hypothetical protein MASR1M42_15290 [Azonexus hydrophilus]